MNSFQRIEEYIHQIPQEKETSEDAVTNELPVIWPQHGRVSIRDLTVGYSLDGRSVLKSLDLDAEPGKRVAIVGRSGSGKSSLAMSMLRLTTKFAGTIQIDGLDIADIIPRLKGNYQ